MTEKIIPIGKIKGIIIEGELPDPVDPTPTERDVVTPRKRENEPIKYRAHVKAENGEPIKLAVWIDRLPPADQLARVQLFPNSPKQENLTNSAGSSKMGVGGWYYFGLPVGLPAGTEVNVMSCAGKTYGVPYQIVPEAGGKYIVKQPWPGA